MERWRTDRHRAEHTVWDYVYGGLGCPGPLPHPPQNQMNTLNLPLPLTKGTCPRELQQRGSSLRRAGTGESRDWRWGGVTKNKNLHSGWKKGPAASQALSPPFGNQALPPRPDIWREILESLKLKLVKAQTLRLGCLVHVLTFPLFTCESLDKFTSSLGPNFLVWKIGIIHLYKFISRMKIDKIENHWIRNTQES